MFIILCELNYIIDGQSHLSFGGELLHLSLKGGVVEGGSVGGKQLRLLLEGGGDGQEQLLFEDNDGVLSWLLLESGVFGSELL